MKPARLAKYLPHSIQTALFGDRDAVRFIDRANDPDWKLWREIDLAFYDANQRQSVGSIVNASGYRVMRNVDLTGKTILEIGPGSLDHMAEWRTKPAFFHAVDISSTFLQRAVEKLKINDIPFQETITLEEDHGKMPLPDSSVDIVLSFYSLEHLDPLDCYIREFHRVLRPGGLIAGAIPCEGGLGWALGRYITSRRWLMRQGISDPGKIIAWEHCNFADDILANLHRYFSPVQISYWPLGIPIIDTNLVSTFIMQKQSHG